MPVVCAEPDRDAFARAGRGRDLFARQVVLEAGERRRRRRRSRRARARPAATNVTRALTRRPIASASASAIGQRGPPATAARPSAAPARSRLRAMSSRIVRRSERSTSSVETASASDVAAKMPRNVRVRKVTARRRRIVQLVAELLDRRERGGEQRDLLAQPPDVHVHGARAARVLIAPDVGQQQIARQHAAAMLEQVLQQQELLRREPDVVAADVTSCRSRSTWRSARTGARVAAGFGRSTRRRSAATRATSSFGLNGLVT